MNGSELRQVYLAASEGVDGWWISVRVSAHDDEGTIETLLAASVVEPLPGFEDPEWQALAVLDLAAALIRLEAQRLGVALPPARSWAKRWND